MLLQSQSFENLEAAGRRVTDIIASARHCEKEDAAGIEAALRCIYKVSESERL